MVGLRHDKPTAPGQLTVFKYQMWILNLMTQGALNFTLPLKYLVWVQLALVTVKLTYLQKVSCGAAVSRLFKKEQFRTACLPSWQLMGS